MPSVASEATTPSFKPSLPNPARPAQSSDPAQSSPFESLLDSGIQDANDPPPPQEPDRNARSEQTDSAQSPARSRNRDSDASRTGKTDDRTDTRTDAKSDSKNGCKTDLASGTGTATQPDTQSITKCDTKSGTTTDTSLNPAGTAVSDATDAALATDAAVVCGKALDNCKMKTGTKTGGATTTGDDTKATGDGKVAGSLTPPDPTAVSTIDSAQTIVPVVAPVTPPVPVPVAPPQVDTATLLQAAIDASTTVADTTDTPKAKATDSATPKYDTDKFTADFDALVKTASAPQSEDKPQPVTGDTDKPAALHTNNDVPPTSHHTANAETSQPAAPDVLAAAPKVAADALQQTTLPTPSNNVAQSATNPTAPAQPVPQALAVPLAGIAVEIAGKALEGKNRFEIRLDPPELGRIEVRLDVDRDGNATTRLIADRTDTLDLLRRDSSGLERALQDAGLKTADNSLQFSLRDQSMGRDQGNTPTPGAAQIVINDDALPGVDINPRNYPRLAGLGGGIDIRV